LDYQDATTEGPLSVDPKLCPICVAAKPKSLSRRSYRCEHTVCAGCCRVLHPGDCKEHSPEVTNNARPGCASNINQ
jgi:hypothetical protein